MIPPSFIELDQPKMDDVAFLQLLMQFIHAHLAFDLGGTTTLPLSLCRSNSVLQFFNLEYMVSFKRGR